MRSIFHQSTAGFEFSSHELVAGWLGLWHIYLCRLFNFKSIFMHKLVALQWLMNTA